jgi:cysteine synthase
MTTSSNSPPPSARVVDNVLELVGLTPLIRLQRLSPPGGATVWAKGELFNPSGSVKDRPALAMVRAAEASGQLGPGSTVVEATSGNTGISLALISSVRGYRCVLVMPEDMSLERRYILRAYGAEIALTPAAEGMTGAVAKAKELVRTTPGAFMPSQFENPANPGSHEAGTAVEILEQLAHVGRSLDVFVAGVGTGGTISGVGRALKAQRPEVQVIAVEPKGSAVLSGGRPGMHAIQGLGAGFVPKTYDPRVVDKVMTVTDPAAERMARELARKEGLLVGPSAGANVHVACQIAATLPPEANVVTVLCDTGERYLS